MKNTNIKRLAAAIMSTAIAFPGGISLPAVAYADGYAYVSSSQAFDYTGTVTFSDGAAVASGDNIKVEGTRTTITASGTYLITGSCSDGSVTVKKGTTGVTLVLADLTLASSTGAPICCNKETETTIVLSGTNRLTDNEDPADEESADAEVADAFDGCVIKAKSDSKLVLTGDGTLIADGTACKNGIRGKGDVYIVSGTYEISCANDAVHSDYTLFIGEEGSTDNSKLSIAVKQATEGLEGASVIIYSGTIDVIATDDGINAANSDLTDWTYQIDIWGGDIRVDAGGDGIDSNGNINTYGGTVLVFGSANGGNAAIDVADAGGKWTNTDATVMAVGYGQMSVVPSSGSYITYGSAGMMGGMGMMGDQPGRQMDQMPANGQQMGQMPANGQQMGQVPADGQQMGHMPMGGAQRHGSQQMGQQGQMPANDQQMEQMPSDQQGGMGMGTQQGNGSISAGDTISVTDASGNVIYSAVAVKSADSVVFASPSLSSGSFSITVGNAGESAATDANADTDANAGTDAGNDTDAGNGTDANAGNADANANAGSAGDGSSWGISTGWSAAAGIGRQGQPGNATQAGGTAQNGVATTGHGDTQGTQQGAQSQQNGSAGQGARYRIQGAPVTEVNGIAAGQSQQPSNGILDGVGDFLRNAAFQVRRFFNI